jgi:hypothetical protein
MVRAVSDDVVDAGWYIGDRELEELICRLSIESQGRLCLVDPKCVDV